MRQPFKLGDVGSTPTAPTNFREYNMNTEEDFDNLVIKHHIWCNFFGRPVKGCDQCKGLWKLYPYETHEDANGLIKKHFPNVIEIK